MKTASLRGFSSGKRFFKKFPRPVFQVERFRPVGIAARVHHRLRPNSPIGLFRFDLKKRRLVIPLGSHMELPPQNGDGQGGDCFPMGSPSGAWTVLGNEGNHENPTRCDQAVQKDGEREVIPCGIEIPGVREELRVSHDRLRVAIYDPATYVVYEFSERVGIRREFGVGGNGFRDSVTVSKRFVGGAFN